MTAGYSFFTSAISHFMNSAGTSSTISQRNPSTPIDAQYFTISSILSHVGVRKSQ